MRSIFLILDEEISELIEPTFEAEDETLFTDTSAVPTSTEEANWGPDGAVTFLG